MQILKNRQIALTIIAFIVLAFTFLAIPPGHSLAACNPQIDPNNPQCNPAQPGPAAQTEEQAACSNTETDTALNNCLKSSKVVGDLQTIVNVLAAGIGIVVVGMIILGGIQYSLAGDNATAVSAAKQRIINALIALIAFIFMYAFVNWLIPGGVFG